MVDTNQLALAAQAGDSVALAAFVRATQADVWRLHRHLVGREEADDATQETFVRALRSLPTFRGESSARTWLLTIARRTAADVVRQRARRRLRDGRAAPPGRHQPDPAEEVALTLLLDELTPDRREAFVLTQVLGLGYEQAAAVIGCPIGTVRSRVARSRDDLIRATSDRVAR